MTDGLGCLMLIMYFIRPFIVGLAYSLAAFASSAFVDEANHDVLIISWLVHVVTVLLAVGWLSRSYAKNLRISYGVVWGFTLGFVISVSIVSNNLPAYWGRLAGHLLFTPAVLFVPMASCRFVSKRMREKAHNPIKPTHHSDNAP